MGYNPVVKVTTPLVGKHLGRMLGAVAVFALSGWMHDQGKPEIPFVTEKTTC